MYTIPRGKFVVLDGIDGSGKGTQAELAANYLYRKAKDRHVFRTREPYHSEYYAEIRRILKESRDPKEHAEVLADLFVKDRRVHAEVIERQLAEGIHVVCDRYSYSTLAYQQTQGISLPRLIKMHDGVLIPDLVLLIDVPVAVALERISRDEGREYREMFEEHEFQEELRQNYLNLPKALLDHRIVVVDGNQPPGIVFAAIQREVEKFF